MAKYLTLKTTNDGTCYVPIGDGLLCQLISATVVNIYPSTVGLGGTTAGGYIELATTGATIAMVDNMNAAQVEAAETGWQNSVVAVVIPSGETIADFAVK
tara:strand:- start:706 stop:1005 length:300 start_codon:yes stop_codon:yes gene_type:complete